MPNQFLKFIQKVNMNVNFMLYLVVKLKYQMTTQKSDFFINLKIDLVKGNISLAYAALGRNNMEFLH